MDWDYKNTHAERMDKSVHEEKKSPRVFLWITGITAVVLLAFPAVYESSLTFRKWFNSPKNAKKTEHVGTYQIVTVVDYTYEYGSKVYYYHTKYLVNTRTGDYEEIY